MCVVQFPDPAYWREGKQCPHTTKVTSMLSTSRPVRCLGPTSTPSGGLTDGPWNDLKGFRLGGMYAVAVDGRMFVLDEDSDTFFLVVPHHAGCAQGDHWWTFEQVPVPIRHASDIQGAIMELDLLTSRWWTDALQEQPH